MARVTVVGAVNVDLVVAADRLPGPGETVVGPDLLRTGGGKGANAAVAAAARGAATTLVGAVGDDDAGRFARDDLTGHGVDVSALQVLPGHATGTALIVVDAAGENQIAVALGANGALDAATVRTALAGVLDATGCVLVSTELPDDTVIAAVTAARAAGVTCVLNPAPVRAGIAAAVDENVVLTPNAGEAVALAEALGHSVSSTEQAAVVLQRRTGGAVVVTMGAAGSLVLDADEVRRVGPAAVDRVVDTTGAGDCFNGTLAAALAGGAGVYDAVLVATAAAGESVGWVGARRRQGPVSP